ncbi:hypothetical protein BCY86_04135 [Pajaroellobacter abortibovis]|uniref:Uncharacterized protein n=1 Tax=Pajaroellobacter abortibovis TaxID=1882918 RepID=A0A1L6MWM9_9BACT|nr:hypothetical protein BCY86_04135 [Pajaroellobacter abortibovis]
MAQGIQDHDLFFKPYQGSGDTDTSVISLQLTDAAICLLTKQEQRGGQFFYGFTILIPMPIDMVPTILDILYVNNSEHTAFLSGKSLWIDLSGGRTGSARRERHLY